MLFVIVKKEIRMIKKISVKKPQAIIHHVLTKI